jgi:hypothetical protein
VLTFVLCRVAADDPSITFELASTSACALQNAVHCSTLHKTEDERDDFFEPNPNAFRMPWYSLCVPLSCSSNSREGCIRYDAQH